MDTRMKIALLVGYIIGVVIVGSRIGKQWPPRIGRVLTQRAAIGGIIMTGALVLAVTLLAGCSSVPESYATEDCDAGDLREYDTGCDYWDADGTFVLWYWVTSSGGHKPSGFQPVYPHGKSRPPHAKATAPKHQKPPAVAPKPAAPRPAAPIRGGRR